MDISTATPTQRNNRTLILGLGNRVMTDDGAGLVALDRFQERYKLPDTVDAMDGGTLGLELLVYMDGYDAILITDCVMRGGEPGDVLKVEAEDIETVFARCLSPHQMGIKDLIAVLRLQGRMPAKMVVVGIEGSSIELGTELTDVVEGSVDEAVQAMVEVLGDWGHEVSEL